MGKFLSIIGIVFVMIGTIFSLWSILTTNTKDYGTCGWIANLQDNFKRDKKKVIGGTILIIIGSIFQISGLFF